MSENLERAKKIIAEEDPEVVARLFASMMDHVQRTESLIKEIEKEKTEKAQQAFNIEEKLKLLRRSIFGRSSEKRAEASDRARDQSQEEAMLFSQSAFPSLEKRDGKKNDKNLEAKEFEHRLTSEELTEESKLRELPSPSSEQWVETSFFDEVTRIQVIERKYIKEIHKKFKHKLKPEFNPTDKDIFVTASAPPVLLPGMNYTTEFVASVIADKYISHMPLERQTREMESLGLKGMKTSTLSRLSALGAASLEPLQVEILKELLKSDLALHLDETPWKIQVQQDGYMWVVSNRYGSYYFFRQTRSGKVIKAVLEGYTGPVVTDGYSGYNILEEEKIPQAFCWAHARRQFLPLEDHDPTVKPILDAMDELFRVEREAKTFEELKALRKEKSEDILHRLKQKLEEEYPAPRSRPGSQKRKAIEYVLSRWEGFTRFAQDTRIPLSNNEAERTIRHAVMMGRKNYYGSNNHSGAETAATLFTIIESCKKNDVDPRTFILMTLEKVARGELLETPLAYARRTRSH
jgi:transposase